MMPFDGRTTQPVGKSLYEPQSEQKKREHSIDWAHMEQRHTLRERLSKYRYEYIDDIPAERIMRGDPNFNIYKCKSTFMTALSGNLQIALLHGVLTSPSEVAAAKAFIQFVGERARRHQRMMVERMTDADRAFLRSQEAFNHPEKVAALMKERLWIPTTRDEVDFINKTLDVLIDDLSLSKKNQLGLDEARAA